MLLLRCIYLAVLWMGVGGATLSPETRAHAHAHAHAAVSHDSEDLAYMSDYLDVPHEYEAVSHAESAAPAAIEVTCPTWTHQSLSPHDNTSATLQTSSSKPTGEFLPPLSVAPPLPPSDMSSSLVTGPVAEVGVEEPLVTLKKRPGVKSTAPCPILLVSSVVSVLSTTPVIALIGANFWRSFLAGAICCSLSHAAATPLDVVKTRLQCFPGLYAGSFDAFSKIVAQEGVPTLFAGSGATFLGYALQGSLKFGFYEAFRGQMLAGSLLGLICASACADVIGCSALAPLEAARIRTVLDPTFAAGPCKAVVRLTGESGFGALYQGLPALLVKQVPYTVTQMVSFHLLKQGMASLLGPARPAGLVLLGTTFCAIAAGMLSSLASQPGDALLSKISSSKGGGASKPVCGVMYGLAKDLGLHGLYRGAYTRMAHVSAIVTVQLLIFDLIKHLLLKA